MISQHKEDQVDDLKKSAQILQHPFHPLIPLKQSRLVQTLWVSSTLVKLKKRIEPLVIRRFTTFYPRIYVKDYNPSNIQSRPQKAKISFSFREKGV